MKDSLDNFFRWLKDVTYLKDLIIRLIVIAPILIGAFFLWFISVPLLIWYLYVKFGNQRISGCKCPRCGKLNACNDKFCIYCGSSMVTNYNSNSSSAKPKQEPRSSTKTCTKCGYENEPDAKFCIKCGSNQFIDSTVYAEDQTIAGYIITLLAYIAKGDDVISQSEAALISNILDDLSMNDNNLRAILKDIFNRAKDKPVRDHQAVSQNLYKAILSEMDSISERQDFMVYIAMFFMALVYVEGKLNAKQNVIVTEVLQALRFTEPMIRGLHEQFQETQHADPNVPNEKDYEVLGCKTTDTDEQVKRAYREMAKKYHPDTLGGKDIPEAVMILATEKFKEINAAYEKIKKHRGIR